MRHFLQGAPLPVPRLPSRMGTPASPGLLIHTARRPLPLPLGQRRTGRRTVSAPTVAGPTHKKLTPASGAATVDEIHAAASSPPGWTSSGPRAIQDLFGRSRFARGHLRGLGALTPGPWPIWGAVTSSPLRHHAWQHQPAPPQSLAPDQIAPPRFAEIVLASPAQGACIERWHTRVLCGTGFVAEHQRKATRHGQAWILVFIARAHRSGGAC